METNAILICVRRAPVDQQPARSRPVLTQLAVLEEQREHGARPKAAKEVASSCRSRIVHDISLQIQPHVVVCLCRQFTNFLFKYPKQPSDHCLRLYLVQYDCPPMTGSQPRRVPTPSPYHCSGQTFYVVERDQLTVYTTLDQLIDAPAGKAQHRDPHHQAFDHGVGQIVHP